MADSDTDLSLNDLDLEPEERSLPDPDPNGDVTLIIGDLSDAGKRIRVSSTVMSSGSPVFKSMLAPRFKEGRELADSLTVEIPLPDDDSKAMQSLCHILHKRYDVYDAVPDEPTLEEIVCLASTADKYGCAEAVNRFADRWIWCVVHGAGEPTASHAIHGDGIHGQLMTAACLLRDENSLQTLAIDLVMKSKIPVTQISKSSSRLQEKLLDKIEIIRLAHLRKITYLVEDQLRLQIFEKGFACSTPCDVAALGIVSHLEQLIEAGIWPTAPLNTKSLGKLCLSLARVYLKDPVGLKACEAGENCFKDELTLALKQYSGEYHRRSAVIRSAVEEAVAKEVKAYVSSE